MRAIILAAGRGRRMLAMTETQPKCFVQLHGRRLLDWQIEALTQAGLTDISIVRGYMAEAFDVKCRYYENKRWSGTNMLVSLCAAREALLEQTCVVSYSDIVYAPESVAALVSVHDNIAITYDPNWLRLWRMRFGNPLSDAETFKLDERGFIAEIGAKPRSIEEIEGQYMGLLRFTPAGWGSVEEYLSGFCKEDIDRMDMTGLLKGLVSSGVPVKAVRIDQAWYEVDSENDLAVYQAIAPGCLFPNYLCN